MNPNELRIGNLVSRLDIGNGDDRIEKIIELGERAVTSGPIKVICEYDNLNPIPLTEEWLLKLGFFKSGELWHNGLGTNIFYDLENHYVRQGFGHETYGTVFHISAMNVKYVHQLQNLYFALTAEEI